MRTLPLVLCLLFLSSKAFACPTSADLGMVGDGTTLNDTAFNTWASSLTSPGGCIEFLEGKFKFNSPHTIVIPNPGSGSGDLTAISTITIKGQGADITALYFPTGNGLTFDYASEQHAVHLRDFSITTSGEDSGTAITLTNSYTFFGSFVAQSDIEGVTCRGDDGYGDADYWSSCVNISNVSDVNFSNINLYGNNTGIHGTGIDIDQPGAGCFASPITCGTNYNIVNSNLTFLGTAIIYGANTQAVAITNTQFLQDQTGIWIPSSGGTLQGLQVNNSTFFTLDNAIAGASTLPNIFLYHNLFNVGAGYYAVSIVESDGTIQGNQFIPRTTPNSGAGGISIAGNTGDVMAISGNTFSSTGQAIFLQSGTSGIIVSGNAYTGNTGTVLNSGTGNTIIN